jgi:2-amino-4-hydroxy-6-hydroxymethyldihydropteridine diphosphokinase
MKFRKIFVAIGANLPGPAGEPAICACNTAIEALRGLGNLHFLARSRWYRTTPVPASDQPDYINGIALLAGDTTPSQLLAALQRIELSHGRVRSVANAARTLDLDIIAMDDLLRDAPDPILPHPRAHERGFVMQPLAEICPDWVHPRLHRTVAALLAAMGPAAADPVPLE